MIVILNGPLVIGKIEISWELLYHFERAVMLDGDYIGAVVPFEIYNDDRIEYLYQTIHHLVAYHQEQGGYHDFVINYGFETPESLGKLRHLLADLDDVIYAFRLTCSEEEIARRIQKRGVEPDQLTLELQRFRELCAIQEANAQQGDLGFAIDTSRLSAREAANVIWQNIHEAVILVSYKPEWPAQYELERMKIADALGNLMVGIHHIGSTSVPGLSAKPVIDILVTVRQLSDVSRCIAQLSTLGYIFIDYPQNTKRRFFRKGSPRTHHLHIVEQGSAEMHSPLDFRDALSADAALRSQYEALKADLAARYPGDRAAYTEAKSAFIRQVIERWGGDNGIFSLKKGTSQQS